MLSSKKYKSMNVLRKVDNDGDDDDDDNGNRGVDKNNGDDDDVTNSTLSKGNSNSVKIKLRRLKSMFDSSLSRSDILNDSSHNIQLWQESSEEATQLKNKVNCAKIFNTTDLKENDLKKLKNVVKLEIEDSEKVMENITEALFSCCNNLTHFSLSWSKIKTIPKELMNSKMRSLKLNDNLIRNLFGLEITNNLETLSLKNNHLHKLPHNIFDLSKLTHLDLSGNNIKELPDFFGNLKSLNLLDLSRNKIKFLPTSIGDLKNLNILKISNNILFSLNPSLSKLSNLSDLQSSCNQLNTLPLSFESLQTLQCISLSYNYFKNIPTCLFNLKNLKTLNLRNNQVQVISEPFNYVSCLNLNNNSLKQLPTSLLQSPSINHLYLNNNNLTAIPDTISQLTQLKVLHLDNNNQIKRLPSALSKLPFLKHISINNTTIPNNNPILQQLQENNILVHGNLTNAPVLNIKSATIAQHHLRNDCISIYPENLHLNPDASTSNMENKIGNNGVKSYKYDSNNNINKNVNIINNATNDSHKVINANNCTSFYPGTDKIGLNALNFSNYDLNGNNIQNNKINDKDGINNVTNETHENSSTKDLNGKSKKRYLTEVKRKAFIN